MNNTVGAPLITQYLDYRAYMHDQVRHLKEQGMSDRDIALRGGLGSPSFIKMIYDGKRRLTIKNLLAVANALGLGKHEAKFLEALMNFQHAQTLEEKNTGYAALLEFKSYRETKSLDRSFFEFFSHWYNVAIFEALGGDYWQRPEQLKKIPKNLGITEKQFQDSLALLQKLGFVEKTEKGYRTGEIALNTAPELQSLIVRNYHRQMITKAQQATESLPQSQRDLGALTIKMSAEKYESFKKDLYEFRSNLNEKYSGDPMAKIVYQLCFQLFPLLRDADTDAEPTLEDT